MSEPDPRDPLYYLGPFPVWRCVRSGFCCTLAPCAFGDWDAEAHRCRHLREAEHGPGFTRYACGIYDEIMAKPAEQRDFNPAFGGGCCSNLFNTNREVIIRHIAAEIDSQKETEPER